MHRLRVVVSFTALLLLFTQIATLRAELDQARRQRDGANDREEDSSNITVGGGTGSYDGDTTIVLNSGTHSNTREMSAVRRRARTPPVNASLVGHLGLNTSLFGSSAYGGKRTPPPFHSHPTPTHTHTSFVTRVVSREVMSHRCI
jgi:hypothetical protein